MTSRYVETRLDSGYSDAQLQLHSHVFYELIYCCTGSETEYLIGSERYLLQPGDIIFVPPGISHRPLIPENSSVPFSRYALWLSQSFMERYANLFPYKFSKNQVHVGMLRTAGTKWEYLVDLFRTGVQEATLQLKK